MREETEGMLEGDRVKLRVRKKQGKCPGGGERDPHGKGQSGQCPGSASSAQGTAFSLMWDDEKKFDPETRVGGEQKAVGGFC